MSEHLSRLLKNLISPPATRDYPRVTRPPFPEIRGQLCIDIQNCVFCGICVRRCPALCLEVDRAAKTWTLDPYKCVICGYCVEGCPKKCLHLDTQRRAPVTAKEKLAQKPTERVVADSTDEESASPAATEIDQHA